MTRRPSLLNLLVGNGLVDCKSELGVLLTYARFANKDTDVVSIGTRTVCEHTGYSPSSVKRIRRKWVERGVLEILGGGQGRGDTLQIRFDRAVIERHALPMSWEARRGRRPSRPRLVV